MIRLVPGRCTACGLCVATCPEHVLRPAPRQPRLVVSSCTGCLECVEVCPVDAIAPAAVAPPAPSISPVDPVVDERGAPVGRSR